MVEEEKQFLKGLKKMSSHTQTDSSSVLESLETVGNSANLHTGIYELLHTYILTYKSCCLYEPYNKFWKMMQVRTDLTQN